MKATVNLQLIATLLLVACVYGQYPPSGYRPAGRQFTLPTRPATGLGVASNLQPQNQYGPPRQPQNQYGPPQNQYGAPDLNSQGTVTPPPDQYLPVDVRNNNGFSNQNNQQDFLNQQQQNSFDQQEEDQNDQQTYLGQNSYQQNNLPDQTSGFGISSVNNQQNLGQRPTLNRQYLASAGSQQGWSGASQASDNVNQDFGRNPGSNRQYLAPTGNQQEWNGASQASDVNQDFGRNPASNRQYLAPAGNQQGWNGASQASDNVNQNFGRNPDLNRQYLSPAENNFQRQRQQGRDFKQTQALTRQLYQSPNKQTNEELNNNEDQNEDLAASVNDNNPKSNFGIASENYLPPTTTERRRYPEPTTRRPEEEPEESEQVNPNVAVATAVARGQYYLWQPDGSLQRVIYKTTQTDEEMKNNGFSAKLVYQPVEPITAPIYTYNAPLVGIS